VSSDHLHATPRLHGWAFDGAFVAGGTDPATFPAKFPRLAADPDVTGLAYGGVVDIILDGEPIEAYALEQVKGSLVHPTLLEGRAPAGPGEIALGTGSLRQLHRSVGGTVVAAGKTGPQRLRIVGRAAYPEFGSNGDVLHTGSITDAGLARLQSQPVTALVLFRVRDGVAVGKVLKRHEVRDEAESQAGIEPKNLGNLHAVGVIPWVLAAFLTALGLAAVAHALVMSVRARRGEIAVLRTMGLVRRQVGLAVAAQATTTVVAGAIVGIPLGVAAGRWTWAFVADGLGVVDAPVVAAGAVVLAVVVALAVANLVASVPAAIAARLRPAVILRAE
jgi:hypothetical protein